MKIFFPCYSFLADNTSVKEHKLQTASSENMSLKTELQAALKAKENALIENRYSFLLLIFFTVYLL